jgi:prepilin-type N-terminal cleavage/methylation domain-containing protein
MFTKPARRLSRAYTLLEMMIAVSVFSIAGVGLGTMFLFCVRSYASLANYSVLDQYDRQAMDLVTREIRQAKQVTGYTSNALTRSLSFVGGDNNQSITYTFDGPTQQFRRSENGATRILLTNCSLLDFGLYMRPPGALTNSTFDLYPVMLGSNWQQNVKVVRLTWKCAMAINPTPRVNSEDIQTACVVIRKQQAN